MQGKPPWLGKAAIIAAPILAVTAALVLGLSRNALWTVPGAAAVLVVGMLTTHAFAFRGPIKGIRCRNCKATYAYGSLFFKNIDANPYRHSIDKVPRPLESSQIRRRSVL